MEQVKLRVSIDRVAALRAGKVHFGEQDVAVTPELLDALGDHREFFIEWHTTNQRLPLGAAGEATTAAIVDAVAALHTKQQAEADENRQHLRANIVKLAEWMELNPPTSDSAYRLSSYGVLDPNGVINIGDPLTQRELQDAIAAMPGGADLWELYTEAANARTKAYRAEVAERIRQRKQAEDEEKAAQQAQKEAVKKALRAYALTVDELARAAGEDYAIESAALKHLLAPLCENAHVIVEGSPMWEKFDWNDRNAPSPEAFRKLDQVKEAVKKLPKVEGVDIEVLRIKRVTDKRGDEYDRISHFTAVVVYVEAAGMHDRAILIPVEASIADE